MPVTQDTIITVKLPIKEMQILLQALGELPYRVSAALIDKMQQQIQPQIQEEPAPKRQERIMDNVQ